MTRNDLKGIAKDGVVAFILFIIASLIGGLLGIGIFMLIDKIFHLPQMVGGVFLILGILVSNFLCFMRL